jgi:murein DD-endopeptidase MepM/ murein hydrolase activator NlpD
LTGTRDTIEPRPQLAAQKQGEAKERPETESSPPSAEGRRETPSKAAPMPNFPPILSPIKGGEMRNDDRGEGHFGAQRGKRPGGHGGLDFLAKPGAQVQSPIEGRITKINGQVYTGNKLKSPESKKWARGFRYIEIEGIGPYKGIKTRLFYTKAITVKAGDAIKAGAIIGQAQDIAGFHNRKRATSNAPMKNHIEIQVHIGDGPWIVRDPNRRDPAPLIKGWKKP